MRRAAGVRVAGAAAAIAVVMAVGCTGGSSPQPSTTTSVPGAQKIHVIPNMPPVVNPANIYSEAAAGMLSPAARKAISRVYVPNRRTGNISVIDPEAMKVVSIIPTGSNPQHVVPSYDMTTLWVANNAENIGRGSLTPIDPTTGKAGKSVPVDDPYNLYFTPDGANAIVVAEARHRLDFRDPHTLAPKFSIDVPTCAGINHMDFSVDGTFVVATCENNHSLVKIDWMQHIVASTIDLGAKALPQDVRLSPDGTTFYVADMAGNQLILIDAASFTKKGSVDLAARGGFGAHGLYPSRDGKHLYVANRGSSARGTAPPKAQGSVSVVDFATNAVVGNWTVPGGGSPDMGGVNADGSRLWLSGRYDDEVYVFDTVAGAFKARITVAPGGLEPHGLCVWPQPGRYSLGHTGNLR